ncbi:MAG: sulfurtransferase [Reichenbachiella sp.]
MSWKINVILNLVILSACSQPNIDQKKSRVESNYLIEVEELLSITSFSKIKIIDFRKKDIYEEGHIAGAIQLWRNDIEDDSYNYKGMMANKEQIESLFSNWGITQEDTLIVYDDSGLSDAARLWWVLQNYNFNQVKLLHGGYEAWKASNGPLTKQSTKVHPSVFKLPSSSSMKYLMTKEEMLEDMNSALIIDTRSLDEYTGKHQKGGATKAGRIPNSLHIDWAASINYHGDKKLKSIQELESIYDQMKVKKDDAIWVYCHSGVRSAHTTFVLTQLLNYRNVKNYDGSWLEWSYYDDLEYEKSL